MSGHTPWSKIRHKSQQTAWAAGFFDGEGWASAIKGVAFTVGIAQKDPRPLERFAQVVEVETTLHQGRLYSLVFSGAKAFVVVRQLWPHLTDPKREQIVRSFETAHANRSRRYPKLNEAYDDMAEFLGV